MDDVVEFLFGMFFDRPPRSKGECANIMGEGEARGDSNERRQKVPNITMRTDRAYGIGNHTREEEKNGQGEGAGQRRRRRSVRD